MPQYYNPDTGKPVATPSAQGAGKQYYDPETGKPIAAPSTTSPAPSTADNLRIIGGNGGKPLKQPGFLENLGHTLGIGKQEAQAAHQQMMEHPVRTMAENALGPVYQAGKAAVGGFMRSTDEAGKAIDALRQGNPASAGVHAVTAVPLVGPALNQMADEAPATTPGQSYLSKVRSAATPGNVGTALGTAAQVAPMLLGAADMAAPGRPGVPNPPNPFPTRAKAGKLFETAMSKAADLPVDTAQSSEPLTRAFEMGERGMTRPKVVNQLMRRMTAPNAEPMNYREARDFAQSLSRQSSTEGQKLTPAMKAQVGKLSHAFNEDVGRTAQSAGVGNEYAQAMKKYRQAMQMRKAIINTAKVGGGALATGYLAHRLIPSVLPDR